jgi:hypothetical protein
LDKLIEQAYALLEIAPLVSSEEEEIVVPDPFKKELRLYQTISNISS